MSVEKSQPNKSLSKPAEKRAVTVFPVMNRARFDKMTARLETLIAEKLAAGVKETDVDQDPEIKNLREQLTPIDAEDDVIESDICAVGLVPLKAKDEVLVAKRVKVDNAITMSNELVKQALVEIHTGDPDNPQIRHVSTGDFSVDQAWDQMPAPVRSLVQTAYNVVHTPTERTIKNFMKGRKVVVR